MLRLQLRRLLYFQCQITVGFTYFFIFVQEGNERTQTTFVMEAFNTSLLLAQIAQCNAKAFIKGMPILVKRIFNVSKLNTVVSKISASGLKITVVPVPSALPISCNSEVL